MYEIQNTYITGFSAIEISGCEKDILLEQKAKPKIMRIFKRVDLRGAF